MPEYRHTSEQREGSTDAKTGADDPEHAKCTEGPEHADARFLRSSTVEASSCRKTSSQNSKAWELQLAGMPERERESHQNTRREAACDSDKKKIK